MSAPRPALPGAEYEAIFAKVPRLTVEVVVTSADRVLLTRRQSGPCAGLWHLPGGTVRYGEPLTDAVLRVAEMELGARVEIDDLLGYIEYPSHLERGLDWPVGIAFRVHLTAASAEQLQTVPDVTAWFSTLPQDMHEEQKAFLRGHGLVI